MKNEPIDTGSPYPLEIEPLPVESRDIAAAPPAPARPLPRKPGPEHRALVNRLYEEARAMADTRITIPEADITNQLITRVSFPRRAILEGNELKLTFRLHIKGVLEPIQGHKKIAL